MPNMAYPKADRVPRKQRVTHQTRMITLTSEWEALRDQYFWTSVSLLSGDPFALPGSHNPYGNITVRIKNVDTSGTENVRNFMVRIGSRTPYMILNEFHWAGFVLTEHHPFFYQAESACGDVVVEEILEAAYPPRAIFDNAVSLADPENLVLHVWIYPSSFPRPDPNIDFGCEEGGRAEVQIELTYRVSTTIIDPVVLDEPLDLWGEDISQNIVSLPAVPRRDHIEFGSRPRMIGFSEDRAYDAPIPGRHFIPKGFMEPFSGHKTRMVDEIPVFTNAVTKTVGSVWTELTSDPEGVTQLLIEGIPAIPGAGNMRGTIIVRLIGVDVSDAPENAAHYFFVRIGAEGADDSYDIPAGSDFPGYDFYPFFLRHTEVRDCGNLEKLLERAYPAKAIFDNVTGPEDGPWDLSVFLRWQGPEGFYGNCGSDPRLAQVLVRYEVFEGPETPAEVCKHSYASIVIGSDGFARGLFCSQHDPINVQRAQENHWAHPFVNRGTVDHSEAVDGQRDFSVSWLVPPGLCAFLGAYHAPRWTEVLLFSERQICQGEI